MMKFEEEQQTKEMMLALEQQQFGCITLVRIPFETYHSFQTIDEQITTIISNKANSGYGFMAIITNMRVIIYELNADVTSTDNPDNELRTDVLITIDLSFELPVSSTISLIKMNSSTKYQLIK